MFSVVFSESLLFSASEKELLEGDMRHLDEDMFGVIAVFCFFFVNSSSSYFFGGGVVFIVFDFRVSIHSFVHAFFERHRY